MHFEEAHPSSGRSPVFVGENGTGKSTALWALARELGYGKHGGTRAMGGRSEPDSGEEDSALYRLIRGPHQPRDGYFFRGDSISDLKRSVEDFQVSHTYGHRKLSEASHGDTTLSILKNKSKGRGIYLLDEPESGLSTVRQLAALSLIRQLVEDSSQFILITHSPLFMAYPGCQLLNFSESGIREVAYTETEAYQVTRDFTLGDPG